MREAFDEIQRLSEDPATRAASISREIHLRDQIQRELDAKTDGEHKGIQKGIQRGKTEVILNMYNKKYSIEAIADVTDMPVEAVLQILAKSID